ncbi:ammonium transporter [Marinomonas sp. 5E14-1]|uniref:ammonium transporter n=1 Tax=Marinomonas sp. 5E14-1 TaxID=3153922 RepID=UPI0032660764
MSELYWLLTTSVLVFIMQAGFLCLESGRIRSKNSINVAAKNISDFIVSTILFWLFGFGIMFGDSIGGFFGFSDFFFSEQHTPWQISFFVFQMMFCGTAATLTSGAVAERMTFMGYLAITVVLSTLIYPVVGHWSWSGVYSSTGGQGWLEAKGFIDFAGSTVVHSVGGWIALVSIMIIGPRIGFFEQKIRLPPGNNLPLSTLGVLLIWLGWFGFNGGSTLALTNNVPTIILNTFISAAWGGLVAVSINYFRDGYVDVSAVLGGVIAGLVGITAACHIVSPSASVIIGGVSGLVAYFGNLLMKAWNLDDALDVVPTHLFAGIWGTLCVALFGQKDKIANGLTFWDQLWIQAFGVVVIGLYCFIVGYAFIWLINRFMPLRVTKEQEEQGLNVSEHKATTELFDLLTTMQYQQNNADFSTPVPEEPFTEVGQIARKYNQVIERVSSEITQRDDALMRFQESEMRKSAILNSSMDCIITINRFGSVMEFNPSAERTFGCLKNQVEGKSFVGLFVLEEDRKQIFQSLDSGFSTSTGLILNRRNPFRLQRAPNDHFPAEITITKTQANGDSEYTLHIKDMTRDMKLQERLKFLAYSDPLTSLYNRTYFMDSLVRALAVSEKKKESVGVLFLDLDKFKLINDTLGHKAGDELLCEVARRLFEVADESDVVARWGGDEFIFMMTDNVSTNHLMSRANQILDVMRKSFVLSGQDCSVPVSIGIACSYEQTIEAAKLIQQADIAMYCAKEKGRDNAQLFTQEMASLVTQRFGFDKEIQDALASDQFSLVFQPKVQMEKENILGLEALVRWNHPSKGFISPGEFIPIAEESNLIIKVDEWVIDTALKQQKAWCDTGVDVVPIAVNLSGRHLVSESVVDYISQKLDFYNLSGSMLEIEITEGVLLTDIQRCIEVMTELKALDIKISIDDFGTGYSSLNYLRRLPLNTLKIDQSFIEECDKHTEDVKICETIISLANGLGLIVIAEGVETISQAETLKSLGCEIFQGYFYHKPMKSDEVVKLL